MINIMDRGPIHQKLIMMQQNKLTEVDEKSKFDPSTGIKSSFSGYRYTVTEFEVVK